MYFPPDQLLIGSPHQSDSISTPFAAKLSEGFPVTPNLSSSRVRKSRLKRFLFGSTNGSANGLGFGQDSHQRNLNRGGGGSNGMGGNVYLSKRPLKAPILQPPDYVVDSQIFIDSYIEIESQLLGCLRDVQRSFCLNSRKTVLQTIDKAKQLGQLPYTYQPCDEIIVSLSVHNVKLLRRENDSLIQRIFLHEIDSVGMVVDCAVTYVLIKIVTTPSGAKRTSECRLLILKFVNSSQADELCALFKQLFASLFNETALRILAPSPFRIANSSSPKVSPQSHPSGSHSVQGSSDQSPFKNGHSNQAMSGSGGPNSSMQQISSRTSSMAFENSGKGLRPTSFMADSFGLQKSNSMYYDSSPCYSPSVRSGDFPMASSLPKNNNHFHQRAFSEMPDNSSSASSSCLKPTTPRAKSFQNQDLHSNKAFLQELDKILSPSELETFISIIDAYKTGGSVAEFIEDLGNLLGNERLHIIRHMSKFLPNDHDTSQLNSMLQQRHSHRRSTVRANDSSSVSSQSLVIPEERILGGRVYSFNSSSQNVDVMASNSQYISQDSAVASEGGEVGVVSPPGSAQELSSPANSSMSTGSNTSSFNQYEHRNTSGGKSVGGGAAVKVSSHAPHGSRSKDQQHRKGKTGGGSRGEREVVASGDTRGVSKRPSKNQRNELAEATSHAVSKDYDEGASSNDNNRTTDELPRELLELDCMLAEMGGTISPCNTIGTESATSNTIKDENKTLEAPSGCASNQVSVTLADQKSAESYSGNTSGNTFSRRHRPMELPDDCPPNLKAVFSPN